MSVDMCILMGHVYLQRSQRLAGPEAIWAITVLAITILAITV